MRILLVILAVGLLVLGAASPALAMDDSMCTHDMTNIQSLHDCVVHAVKMGHIDSAGVGRSLLAKVEAAQAAYGRGQNDVAILILQAFISEVAAQCGVHIDAMHAQHVIMHAEMVITAIGQQIPTHRRQRGSRRPRAPRASFIAPQRQICAPRQLVLYLQGI